MVSFIPDIPPGGNWARDFTDKVEEYSGGEMTIKLSGPEAIPAPDQVSAVQSGTVDIASVLSPFADTLVPGASCIGRAEYNPMELRAWPTRTATSSTSRTSFAKSGILYLGASVSSEAQVQTVFYLGKEIAGLADLKGMKIAAVGGSNKAFIESLGAVCIPIDFTDYFTSMERGVVDGYNVGIPGILDFGLTPVTKAMLERAVQLLRRADAHEHGQVEQPHPGAAGRDHQGHDPDRDRRRRDVHQDRRRRHRARSPPMV